MPTLSDLNKQIKDVGELLGKSMPAATRVSLLNAQFALKTRARLIERRASFDERSRKTTAGADDRAEAAMLRQSAKADAAELKASTAALKALKRISEEKPAEPPAERIVANPRKSARLQSDSAIPSALDPVPSLRPPGSRRL